MIDYKYGNNLEVVSEADDDFNILGKRNDSSSGQDSSGKNFNINNSPR